MQELDRRMEMRDDDGDLVLRFPGLQVIEKDVEGHVPHFPDCWKAMCPDSRPPSLSAEVFRFNLLQETESDYPSNLVEEIGLFPLEMILSPRVRITIHVFEMRHRQLFSEAWKGQTKVGIVRHDKDRPCCETWAKHGTTCKVIDLRTHPDGRMQIVIEGDEPFLVLKVTRDGRKVEYGKALIKYRQVSELNHGNEEGGNVEICQDDVRAFTSPHAKISGSNSDKGSVRDEVEGKHDIFKADIVAIVQSHEEALIKYRGMPSMETIISAGASLGGTLKIEEGEYKVKDEGERRRYILTADIDATVQSYDQLLQNSNRLLSNLNGQTDRNDNHEQLHIGSEEDLDSSCHGSISEDSCVVRSIDMMLARQEGVRILGLSEKDWETGLRNQERRISLLGDTISKIMARQSSELDQSLRHIADQSSQIAILEKVIVLLSETNVQAKESLFVAQEEFKLLQGRWTETAAEKAALQKALDMKEDDILYVIDRQHQQIVDQSKEIAAFEPVIRHLKETNKQGQDFLTAAHKELDLLHRCQAEEAATQVALQQALHSKEEEVGQLKDNLLGVALLLEEKEATQVALQKALESKEDEVGQLRDKLQELALSEDNLKMVLQSETDRVWVLQNELERKREEVKGLREEVQNLRNWRKGEVDEGEDKSVPTSPALDPTSVPTWPAHFDACTSFPPPFPPPFR
jgi:hypothetical protein